MRISREEAHRAKASRAVHAVPTGHVVVNANEVDRGLGFFASVRWAREIRYFSSPDRDDALSQACAFALSLGLTLVKP